jgi:hypothetical protein
MLELVGLMMLSALLIVAGNAWGDRDKGQFLIMSGFAAAALIILLIAWFAVRFIAALAND